MILMRFFYSLLLTSLLTSIAFADITPSPGETFSEKITGTAASILGDYIQTAENATQGKFPEAIGEIKIEDRILSEGISVIQETESLTITIGCVSTYKYGRQYSCKLVKTYK